MAGSLRICGRILSVLRTKAAKKTTKRMIICGLKSDNFSRQMLLHLLNFVVVPGDNVLAVHVLEPDDGFDPNTFHIHEDLCRSKQVDFQVKVCAGTSYITELAHQVRINFATRLVLGCGTSWPQDSYVAKCLKVLPPTCFLLVMDVGGRVLFQKPGTSQQGSPNRILQSSVSSLSTHSSSQQSGIERKIQKSLTMPSSSTSQSLQQTEMMRLRSLKNRFPPPHFTTHNLLQRLAAIEAKGCIIHFTFEELNRATDYFSPEMVIGECGDNKVFLAKLDDGQAVAVKVLSTTNSTAQELCNEVEILSGLKHDNIVRLIGYCCNRELYAVVHNMVEGSLRQNFKHLRWTERMAVALGIAKALQYLHTLSPPVIHRDVNPSNILLSGHCQPLLSDFGAAMVHQQTQLSSSNTEPVHVVGTSGYTAPEYVMYGKVDERIDVYSYGVVLLELITGKEATQMNQTSGRESLVLWARSLLSYGLCERLVDPYLNEEYDKDEMKMMMVAARLCLMHSSSRRPPMKSILRLFEEPDHWLRIQRTRDELLNRI